MKINKKGFTLVELLAIIVVLAIIAVLAVPIIMDTIKESKGEVNERSVENYIKAIETTVVAEQTRGSEMEDIYLIKEDGNLCPKSEGLQCEYPLEIKGTGTKPSAGTIVLENGKVVSSSNGKVIKQSQYYSTTYRTILTINDTKVFYEDEQATTNFLCYVPSEVDFQASVSLSCNFGDGWRSFRILSIEDENITLLMSSNLGENITIEPEEAESVLREQTKNWTKLTKEQINIPTGYQLAEAAGNTSWQEGQLDVFLNTYWLVDNISGDPSNPKGYWTSTPSPATNLHPAYNYYIFGTTAKLAHANNWSENVGVRPVVSITKDQILY